jgi:hypothetical protein
LEEEISNIFLGPMLVDLKAAGASVTLLPYEPAETLVGRVLLAAGAYADEIPQQVPWTNVSMSQPVLMALLDVNRAVKDPLQRLEQRARLFEEIQPACVESNPDLFSPALRNKISLYMANPT